MNNQDDTSGKSLDINQLQWALRHGQKIDGLENIVLSNQPVMLPDNHMDNNMRSTSSAENISVHNSVVEEQFDKLRQSLNLEIVSLKSEFANVVQDTIVEEQIDKLAQSMNQEIISLKSELAVVAQGATVEEQINKLGQSLNQEIISLKSEFGIVAQGATVEELIDKLGQSVNQEIISLKSELAIVGQDMVGEEQLDKLTKSINQEILSLRNEFAMFVQAQLQQEKAWKIAELEWKTILEERETKLQGDIWEMQERILADLEERFHHIDEKLQQQEGMIKQETALLTAQLTEIGQSQGSKEEIAINEWQKKLEERQGQLIEDLGYMQYVLEEMATRPQHVEAQQKLREKFVIREIATLKEEVASACRAWNSRDKDCTRKNAEQESNDSEQQQLHIASEDETRMYRKKKKRRSY